MKIYHVVAMSENRVIGKDGKLPWHFSADLKHFKTLTMGSTIIMGHKTFKSIGSKPLGGRENFVLSHSKIPAKSEEHVQFFNSIDEALKNICSEKTFIIGGASLFEQTWDKIDGVYLTQIKGTYEGDRFYPQIPSRFKEKTRETLQENPKIEVIFLSRE